jgi:hypothetical protein
MSEGAMMSDTTPAGEPTERSTRNADADADASEDRREGGYTEIDGEEPHVRGVPGGGTRERPARSTTSP